MTCGAGLALLGRGGREFAFTGSSDPYWEDVLLLLHGNGADGSTTFTDSSSYNRTLTIFDGTSEIDTSQSLFGGASLYGGTGNTRIRFDMTGPEWDTTDWTWECFYRRSGGGYHALLHTKGDRLRINMDGSTPFKLLLVSSASLWAQSTTAVPVGVWTHLAVSAQKIGANWTARVFVDGVLEGSVTSTDVNLGMSSWPTPGEIGLFSGTGFTGLWGHIEEYRITAACRYTTDFTVPAEAYPDYDEAVVTPPPTTVPPETYTDAFWSSVLFLSAMDLTKVNDKTGIAYTLDSASVTATDPFDGAGALACVYPPSAPTSTPFSTAELTPSQTIEFWVRLDSWPTYTSGPRKWANLVQQPGSVAGDQDFALAISDNLVRRIDPSSTYRYGSPVTFIDTWEPALKLYTHSLNIFSYTPIERKDMSPTSGYCPLPADGQWHHVALVSYLRSDFLDLRQEVYVDGVLGINSLASGYSPSDILEFGGLVTPPTERGQTGYFYPSFPALTGTTFDGAIDEIRITAARRYDGPFVVPHYAFPRS